MAERLLLWHPEHEAADHTMLSQEAERTHSVKDLSPEDAATPVQGGSPCFLEFSSNTFMVTPKAVSPR